MILDLPIPMGTMDSITVITFTWVCAIAVEAEMERSSEKMSFFMNCVLIFTKLMKEQKYVADFGL